MERKTVLSNQGQGVKKEANRNGKRGEISEEKTESEGWEGQERRWSWQEKGKGKADLPCLYKGLVFRN